MPSKYSLRSYIEDGIYHIYNRGVEKRIIFEDEQDYKVFLFYLKRYLTPLPPNEVRPRWIADLHKQLDLLAYCLMPNHFHLLIKQSTKTAITTFMRCLMNSYTRYFNEKYLRVGALLQGKFKAIRIETDEYLLHLTRYIHLNPLVHSTRSDLVKLSEYAYSSYSDYIGSRNTRWVKPKIILDYFHESNKFNFTHKNILNYKSFVEDYNISPEEILGDLVIESNES